MKRRVQKSKGSYYGNDLEGIPSSELPKSLPRLNRGSHSKKHTSASKHNKTTNKVIVNIFLLILMISLPSFILPRIIPNDFNINIFINEDGIEIQQVEAVVIPDSLYKRYELTGTLIYKEHTLKEHRGTILDSYFTLHLEEYPYRHFLIDKEALKNLDLHGSIANLEEGDQISIIIKLTDEEKLRFISYKPPYKNMSIKLHGFTDKQGVMIMI